MLRGSLQSAFSPSWHRIHHAAVPPSAGPLTQEDGEGQEPGKVFVTTESK